MNVRTTVAVAASLAPPPKRFGAQEAVEALASQDTAIRQLPDRDYKETNED